MPRDIYNDTIINTDTNGVPTVLMSGVLVSVYKAGTTTAVTIYTDRAQPTQQPNPFEAVNGVVRFWADQGEYDVNYHDNLLRIADQTIGWNSMPGGAAGITPPMLAPGATPPPGSMFPYVGASEPPGYKLCNGQALAKTTYALLYAALGNGSLYGQDATTFNLPDMRSRLPMGSGQGSGLTSRPLAQYGGGVLDTNTPKRAEETHTLVNAEMPSHSHGGGTGNQNANHQHSGTTAGDYPDHLHTFSYNIYNNSLGPVAYHATTQASGGWPIAWSDGSGFSTTGASARHQHDFGTSSENAVHAHAINADGGSQPHNIVSPYLALNYIIRDGT